MRYRDYRVTLEKDRAPDMRTIGEIVRANEAGVLATPRIVTSSSPVGRFRTVPNRKARRQNRRSR